MNGSGKGREEMDARERSQRGDGQDLVSGQRWEEKKREESKLMDPLSLGDQGNGHVPNRKGKAGLGEDTLNLR